MAFSSPFPLSFFAIIILLLSMFLIHSAAVNRPSDQQSLSTTAALHIVPILSNLGYPALSAAISNFSSTIPWFSAPITLFAPSIPLPSLLLKHHLALGLFTIPYLSQLPLGSTIETLSFDRCLTLTSANSNSNSTIFLDGVEIHRPDLYNDGSIAIHGIRSPLSPSSCSAPDVMTPMLRDAVARLKGAGYGVLAMAMEARWTELTGFDNMTVFAVEDREIFHGEGRAYAGEVGFHVVPGRMMRYNDLAKLGVGTVMATMEVGRNLVVTKSLASSRGVVKINYVPIKAPDAVWNGRIAVHGLWFPFPRLYLADLNIEGMEMDREISSSDTIKCGVLGGAGECKVAAPTVAGAALPKTSEF